MDLLEAVIPAMVDIHQTTSLLSNLLIFQVLKSNVEKSCVVYPAVKSIKLQASCLACELNGEPNCPRT